jgi:hypothetical protein
MEIHFPFKFQLVEIVKYYVLHCLFTLKMLHPTQL